MSSPVLQNASQVDEIVISYDKKVSVGSIVDLVDFSSVESSIESLQTEISSTKDYIDSEIENLPDLSIYDIIIRTQEEFDEMTASDTWLDATSVAIIGLGTRVVEDSNPYEENIYYISSVSDITVPWTVSHIYGFNNPCIEGVTMFGYEGYTEEASNSISNITVMTKYISRADNDSLGSDINSERPYLGCFYGFNNMYNCRGIMYLEITSENERGYDNDRSIYHNCDALTSCKANYNFIDDNGDLIYDIYFETTPYKDCSRITATLEDLDSVTVDLTGYATEEYVDEKISEIPETDLTDYATKSYVDEEVSKIDTSTYVTTTTFNEYNDKIVSLLLSINGI